MVTYLFPGWVNADENGGAKLVKKTLFGGSMLVVIYTGRNMNLARIFALIWACLTFVYKPYTI